MDEAAALAIVGFEILEAAEASEPLNADDCFSRKDDMIERDDKGNAD